MPLHRMMLKGPAVGSQVDALLRQISEYDKDVDVAIVALETLAKIAWNNDEVTIHNRTTHSIHGPCQSPSQRCFFPMFRRHVAGSSVCMTFLIIQ
jgi:hypothetical protein